jgi:hypothetical protein
MECDMISLPMVGKTAQRQPNLASEVLHKYRTVTRNKPSLSIASGYPSITVSISAFHLAAEGLRRQGHEIPMVLKTNETLSFFKRIEDAETVEWKLMPSIPPRRTRPFATQGKIVNHPPLIGAI